MKFRGAEYLKHRGITKRCNLVKETEDVPSDDFPCCWVGCEMKFSEVEEFYCHAKKHAEDDITTSFICHWDNCLMECRQKCRLADHLRTHTKETFYACPDCGIGLRSGSSLDAHIQQQGKSSQSCKGKLDCPYCSETLKGLRELNSHVARKDNRNKRRYICDHCPYSFYTVTGIQKHAVTHKHHNQMPPVSTEGPPATKRPRPSLIASVGESDNFMQQPGASTITNSGAGGQAIFQNEAYGSMASGTNAYHYGRHVVQSDPTEEQSLDLGQNDWVPTISGGAGDKTNPQIDANWLTGTTSYDTGLNRSVHGIQSAPYGSQEAEFSALGPNFWVAARTFDGGQPNHESDASGMTMTVDNGVPDLEHNFGVPNRSGSSVEHEALQASYTGTDYSQSCHQVDQVIEGANMPHGSGALSAIAQPPVAAWAPIY